MKSTDSGTGSRWYQSFLHTFQFKYLFTDSSLVQNILDIGPDRLEEIEGLLQIPGRMTTYPQTQSVFLSLSRYFFPLAKLKTHNVLKPTFHTWTQYRFPAL